MQAAANRFRTLVKICGVRSPEEAAGILAMGADAVGVVIAEGSPRRVEAPHALSIAAACPERTVLVGRGTEPAWVDLARSWPGPVQIHGPARDLGRAFIRAIHQGEPAPADEPSPVACLVDAPAAGAGIAWNWESACTPWPDRPWILAGGLRVDSVAAAIRAVHPWAVDVSSGVERARGVKDLALVREFIASVRSCDADDGRTTDPTPVTFASLR
jgi:phosphoribosylanthranilate isomerase